MPEFKEVAEFIEVENGSGNKFDYKRLLPQTLFSERDLRLSYSTISSYKDCKFKFILSKVLGLSFFTQNEALFAGNMVHKYGEEGVRAYERYGNSSKFENIMADVYTQMNNKFERSQYSSDKEFVSSIGMYMAGKKSFTHDLFFDDYSYLYSIANSNSNYFNDRRELLLNMSNLLNVIVNSAKNAGVTKFYPESWIRFNIDNMPFIGKIDLYFKYFKEAAETLVIVDYKTGKRDYFDWEQLHFYSIYFGEKQFKNTNKYFADVGGKELMKCNDQLAYQDIFDKFAHISREMFMFKNDFKAFRPQIEKEYTDVLNTKLSTINLEDSYKVPIDLTVALMNIVKEVYTKKIKKSVLFSNGSFCGWCDYNRFCPKK